MGTDNGHDVKSYWHLQNMPKYDGEADWVWKPSKRWPESDYLETSRLSYNKSRRRWLKFIVMFLAPDNIRQELEEHNLQRELTEHEYNEIRVANRLDAVGCYNLLRRRGFNMDNKITELIHTTEADIRDTHEGTAPPCFYAPLSAYDFPKQIQHVTLDEPRLEELFSSVVNIRSPRKFKDDKQLYVLKQYEHILGAPSMWNEIQILGRLPRHPNILGLECLVTTNPLYDGHIDLVHRPDSTEPRVFGFTQLYFPEVLREFKLEWAEQLLDLVGFLHLEHGITHNKISVTNLAVNKSTNKILLTGFEKAARIGTRIPVPYPDDPQQSNESQ